MNTVGIWLIWLAGIDLGCVMVANFIVPRMLRYRENIATCDLSVQNVFWSHAFHTVLLLLGMMMGCFLYAEELWLPQGAVLGGSIFMAGFWTIKVFMHLFFFNRELKRRYPAFNLIFLAAFVYLAALFTGLSVKGVLL